MGEKTLIEWTEATWNPVTGCTRVSAGCQHCYAERLAIRLRAMGNPRYRNGFQVTLHPDLVGLPSRWKGSRLIFVNSMSDLFHESVPVGFIQKVFRTMATNDEHVFQILTKRAGRLAELADELPWPNNVWVGVTVENQDCTDRLDDLRNVPARIKFISCEPLLGPLSLDLRAVDWVIVGGESGPAARPMSADWVRSLRDQCRVERIPFFFKQWGGVRDKRGHEKALLDGVEHKEWPASLAFARLSRQTYFPRSPDA